MIAMQYSNKTSKNTGCIIAIIVFLYAVFFPFTLAYASSNEYTISIECDMIDYNHLGKEISYSYKCNGYRISNNEQINISGSSFAVTVTITESDSIPDEKSETFSFINNGKKQSDTKQIRVSERGGKRYPNANATWDVTVTATPVSTSKLLTRTTGNSTRANDESNPDYPYEIIIPGSVVAVYILKKKMSNRNR